MTLETNVLKNDSTHDRLALIGNIKGVLNAIRAHRVQPDMKTFMLLLEVEESYFLLFIYFFNFYSRLQKTLLKMKINY